MATLYTEQSKNVTKTGLLMMAFFFDFGFFGCSTHAEAQEIL